MRRSNAVRGYIACFAVAFAAVTAHAQEPMPSADETVRAFAAALRSHTTDWSRESVAAWVGRITSEPSRYPAAAVVGVLDRLASLAISDPDSHVRLGAVLWLARAGNADMKWDGPRAPGVVRRLEHVFWATNDGVRYSIVDAIPRQGEADEAAALLERIAVLPPEADFARAELPVSHGAVRALLRMGERGRGVLQRLHAQGAVQNTRTRALMEVLAKKSFRNGT